MENKFSKAMTRRTTGELMGIISIHRQDYLPEALLAAANELENRKAVGLSDYMARPFRPDNELENSRTAGRHDYIGREFVHNSDFCADLIDVQPEVDFDLSFDFIGEFLGEFFAGFFAPS